MWCFSWVGFRTRGPGRPQVARLPSRRLRQQPARRQLSVEPLEGRILLHGADPVANQVEIKWSFGDTVLNDYVLTSFSAQDANLGPIGGLQPAIRLVIGTRYTVTVSDPVSHPLQLIAKGATAFDDVVLLSQNSRALPPGTDTGPFEADPAVAFQDDGRGTIRFTLTQALADAMIDPARKLVPGYRCGQPFHRSFQRGDFTLVRGEAPDKFQPDDVPNTFATARPLSLGVSGSGRQSGRIDFAGDVDLFRFVAPVTGRVSVTQTALPGSALDGVLFAYDHGQRLLALNAQADGQAPRPGYDRRIQFDAIAGQTYFAQAAGFRASTGSYLLAFGTQPRDSPFPGASFVALDDAGLGAVREAIGVPGEADAFFLVAPVTGRMTLTQTAAPGSSLDSLVSVFNSSGVLLASDDDGGGGLNSQVQLEVVAGETYLVRATGRVHSRLAAGGALVVDPVLSTGAYELQLVTDDFPETFATAASLTLDRTGSGSQTGQVEKAGDVDVFGFVAPVSGEWTVVQTPAAGSSLTGSLAVFTAGQVLLGRDHDHGQGVSQVRIPVTQGQAYFVRVAGAGPRTGRYLLTFAVDDVPDTFAGARLVSLAGSGFASLSGAIGVPGDGDLYRFVAPAAGEVVVTQSAASGTALDSLLSAFDTGHVLLARNDDDGHSLNSHLRLPVAAGQAYFLQAAGFGASTGRYDLTLALDDFADTTAGAAFVPLDAAGSGRQAGSIGPRGDVDLFRFVAPVTDRLPLILNAAPGSTFDGRLQVFDGTGHLLADDDDSAGGFNSQVQLGVVAGQTYVVQVAGFSSSTGAYDLILGDDFADTSATAPPIVLDAAGSGVQSGRIEKAGDVDVFRFVAPVSGEVTVVQTPAARSSLSGSLAVFDGSAVPRGSDQDNGQKFARVRLAVVQGQEYFVQVAGSGSTSGPYLLSIAVDDFGDRLPVPDPRQVLTLTGGPAGRTGRVEVPFDKDTFEFVAAAAGELVLTQVPTPGSNLRTALAVSSVTPGGAEVVSKDEDRFGKGFSRVQLTVTPGRRYVVQAGGLRSSTGGYNLGFKVFTGGSQGLVTEDLRTTTAEALVRALLGNDSGIAIVPGSVRYTGAPGASGLFAGGAGILGFDRGILLTTGLAGNVRGPNFSEGATGINNRAGSPDLDRLVRGGTTDAAVLSFDFIPTASNVVRFQYVFGSEEYNEFVGSPFNDVFALFINGINYARIPGTGTPVAGSGAVVSIHTINANTRTFFVDNAPGLNQPLGQLNTQLDGLTTVLTLQAPIEVGRVNRLTLAIADTVDPRYDSAVFLQGGSFQTFAEPRPQGARQFDRFVETIAAVVANAAGLSEEAVHRLIHKAVVNGVIREVDLLGDFLVIPVDPVDFTLTNDAGLKVNSREGQVSGVGNAFFVGDGVNQLLILPNARADQYRVELVGVGSGEFHFGASYVRAFGQVTSVLLGGNLRDGHAVAVLDFARLDGRVEQGTLVSQVVVGRPDPEPPDPAPAPNPNVFLASLLTALITAPQVNANLPAPAAPTDRAPAPVSFATNRPTGATQTLTLGSDAARPDQDSGDFLAALEHLFMAWQSGATEAPPAEWWPDQGWRTLVEDLVRGLLRAGASAIDEVTSHLGTWLLGLTGAPRPAQPDELEPLPSAPGQEADQLPVPAENSIELPLRQSVEEQGQPFAAYLGAALFASGVYQAAWGDGLAGGRTTRPKPARGAPRNRRASREDL